jgi:hypothetical protein
VFAFIVTLGFGSFALWGLSGPHNEPSARGKEGVESAMPALETSSNAGTSSEAAPAAPAAATEQR